MLKFCEVKQSGSDISIRGATSSPPPGSGDVKNTPLKVGLSSPNHDFQYSVIYKPWFGAY